MTRQIRIIEPLGPDASLETAAAQELGVGVEWRIGETREELLEAAAGAEAILIRLGRIDDDFMERNPQLRVIGRCGVGTDNIDLAAATQRGIQVINVPDYCIEEVATHAASLSLAGWRRIVPSSKLGAEGRWWDWKSLGPIRPLSTATLGIVGMGRMGRTFFEMVGSWFDEVVFFDPFVTEAPEGAHAVTLDELFERSDLISLHCPSLPSTRGLVSRERLKLMRPGAVLVNVSRGDLIDEDALLEGLESGTPAYAALDVLTEEPADAGHPLLNHPNVLVTNHIAWLSTEAEKSVRTLLARRCALALLGRDGETVVNARELAAAR